MKIHVVAVGQRMPGWVGEGFEEYRRRLAPPLVLELVEVAAGRRGKNADLARIAAAEGEALLERVPRGALPIALDRAGKRIDTESLARMLASWSDDAQDVAFLVGGPEGLAPSCLARCPLRLSLSDLTFAHPLVRVILAEQIYRAFSINHGLPYHR